MLPAVVLLSLAQDVVLELDRPSARRPDDGTFARAIDARWASGRRCVVGFFGAGRASWTLELGEEREGTLWVRYASANDVTLPFGWGALDTQLEGVALPATGGTSGKYAWGWAALDARVLQPGAHTFTFGAAPLRLDCVAFAPARPTHLDPSVAPALSDQEAALLAAPLMPASPPWLEELAGLAPPAWYEGTRLCLHTRFGPPWVPREGFDTVAERFASLGARSFVRHVRTRGEGQWWPSEAGVVAPWGESSMVADMVARAHAHGQRFIGYYRHLEDTALAEAHPDWRCRDDLGRPMPGRNGDPRVCLNSPYLDQLEARLLELCALGVDGIYFDEDHMPHSGCWCASCAAGFRAFAGLELPARRDREDPRYRRLLEFGALSMERAFARLRRTLKAEHPDVALLIGSSRAPDPLESFGSDRLWRLADGVKTEYGKGHGVRLRGHGTDLPRGVWLALGWTYSRDAAEGRPPHVWCNAITDPRVAQAAAAAVIVHGGVANLDIKEARVPDAAVFADAVALGNALSDALAGATLERWAAVHWPGALREHLVTDDEVHERIAAPLGTSFATSLWTKWPVGVITDSLLAEGRLDGYAVLHLPAPDALTDTQRAAVEAFRARGGAVALPKDDEVSIECLPDWRVEGGSQHMHVVAYRAPDGARLLAMTNDPGWVYTGPRVDKGGRPLRLPEGVDILPPPCEHVRVEVPAGTRRATELLTKTDLAIEEGVVHVPAFQYAAVLRLE